MDVSKEILNPLDPNLDKETISKIRSRSWYSKEESQKNIELQKPPTPTPVLNQQSTEEGVLNP